MMRNLLGIALAGFLALGVAGSAGAATLSYTGTLTFGIGVLPAGVGGGAGQIGATTLGGHLTTLTFMGGEVGPITASLPVTSNSTINSVRLTGVQNLSGVITGISGGPPLGAAQMGLQGMAKICLVFAPCDIAFVPVPLSPDPWGGMGVGGTQTVTGAVNLTMQHMPWTLGAPTMTIHTPGSWTTTTPLPSGFATPPSGTANGGSLQMVTATKVFTSLTTAFPEVSAFSILNLQFFRPPTPPVCDIQMSQGTYTDGDTVTAQVFRFENPSLDPAPIELKTWFLVPGRPDPFGYLNVGADGSAVLPPGFDHDYGPRPLFTVTPGIPRGTYEYNCRLLDPVTGQEKAVDVNPFQVE